MARTLFHHSAMPSTQCVLCDRLDRLSSSEDPQFIATFPQSILVLGDYQFYRGSLCLILKTHRTELHELGDGERTAFLNEMSQAARAMARILDPWKINYEMLGNVCPHMHWHLFPRHADDPRRSEPVWLRPESEKRVPLLKEDQKQLIGEYRRILSPVR